MIRCIIAITEDLGYPNNHVTLYIGVPCWLGLRTSYIRLAVFKSINIMTLHNILYNIGIASNAQHVKSVPHTNSNYDIKFDCVYNDITICRTTFDKNSSILHLCVEPPIRRCIRKFVNKLFPNLMPDYSIHFSKCIAFGEDADIDKFIELLIKSSEQFKHKVTTIID